MSEDKIKGMKVVELKAELDKRGLSKFGAKAVLAQRLTEVCLLVNCTGGLLVFVL